MRRWIIFGVVAVVLLLLAMPLVALYFVAYTEDGLAFIVSRMPKRLANADLTIEGARGTFARGLHINVLEIEHERVYLRFEDIDGRIQLAPLLLQTLRSPDIKIRKAVVEVRTRKTPIPKYEPRFLPRALKIRADGVRIDEGTLIVPNGRRYDVTQVEIAGTARHKVIRVFRAHATMDALLIDTDGRLRAADPMRLDGSMRLNWRLRNQPPWVIDSMFKGDLNALAIRSEFTSPFRADFVGQALELTNGQWRYEGKSRINDLDIRAWGGGGALGRITGELAVTGNARGFLLQGPLTPAGLQAGIFDTLFEGSYANRVITAQRYEITHRSSRAFANGKGSIGIVPNGPVLGLEGNWRDFRWPLVGKDVPVRSAKGEYVLSGVWPFDVRASGMIQVRNLAPMPVEMVGQLDKRNLDVHEAMVKMFDGDATLSGQVTWAPRESWAVSGNAIGINPQHVRKDLPGKLNFAFEASGMGFKDGSDFTARIQRLGGQLRNLPASGAGTIARRKEGWLFENVQAKLGRTDLSLDGRMNGEFDLKFALETQDLGLLAEDSRGRLRAQGTLRGTLAEPTIKAVASGSTIRHKGMSLAGFEANIDFDPHRADRSFIDIRARELTYGDRTIEQARFNLDGTAASHTIRFSLYGPGLSAQSNAQGAYVKGIWRGQLNGLAMDASEESLHLDLEAPIGVLLSAETINVERFCLHGSPARLCGDIQRNQQKWSATMLANDLPMNTFTAGLTPNVDYRGVLNIRAQAYGGKGERTQGNLRVDLRDAQLAHKLASGRMEVVTLGTGTLTATATTERIVSNLSLDAGPVGTIRGSINAVRSSEQWSEMPLDGELHAHTAELSFLGLYFPDIDRAAGRLQADVELSGWAGEPIVNGLVKITDGELDLYQVNLSMRNTSIEARLTDNGLEFNGSARLGDGTAQARGRLTWKSSQPFGRFTLTGNNLRVADVPEAQIYASPNLEFRVEGRRIDVTGTVNVPQARIVPADLTNAVRPSSDEIIVSELTGPSQRSEVGSNITLTLGDRVEVDMLGLNGRLTGSINLRSGYDQITRATGELNVEDGNYTAYGRRLDIERGRLIFTGGPVGNPGMDVRAIKKFQDIEAGINVRGTLIDPRMTFFSEPSLPQTQIVQMILAGGSVQSAQNNRNNGASSELIAQGGAILAQQIGSRVGIEDVGIESSLKNETSIVLGKYLSPKLYVSYGISLTESLNTLKLRYTLGDRWTIRTEFGEEGGADLVYTIDK
jgi:translocation and assembly module TamB